MSKILEAIGKNVILRFHGFLYACGFFFRTLKESIPFFRRRQVGFKVLVMQLLFTGVEALGVVSLIAFSLGAVIIVYGVNLLPQFGQGELIYSILITVITREMGPLLCAFILIARSGTAISTELGQMVVSHQIEAYTSVGVDPISYLAVPRFIGVVLSMILLNIYFNIFGLIASFFLTRFIQPIPVQVYIHNLIVQLKATDLLASFVKSAVFGAIIALVATYNGFRVEQSSTEVPQVVIRSVAQCFILIIVANVLITVIYYL
jgi:phospholipid/cholesterol/gamma-HCH transport system permease protein